MLAQHNHQQQRAAAPPMVLTYRCWQTTQVRHLGSRAYKKSETAYGHKNAAASKHVEAQWRLATIAPWVGVDSLSQNGYGLFLS